MTLLGEKLPPKTDGPWYPAEGVQDRAESLRTIEQYFPGFLGHKTTVTDLFTNAPEVVLLPDGELTYGESLIAVAKYSDGEHQLVYLPPVRQEWRLRFSTPSFRTTFALIWSGKTGHPSSQVYGHFMNRTDFGFTPSSGELKIRSQGGGNWGLHTSIYVPNLKQKLKTTLPYTHKIALQDARVVDDRFEWEYKEPDLRGNWDPQMMTFPHTVAPARFT